MTSISQRIPNLLLGISQQPDNRKFPGQLRDCSNAFPDYALGLLKRPGGKFLADLYGATPTGRWFSILRDEQEKYVSQYADNTFRVWSLIDGKPRKVNMGTNTGVPAACNYTNVQTYLLDYNIAKETTATRLSELQEAEATYAETLAGQTATVTNLFSVSYDYPYADIQQVVESGILQNSLGIYTVKNNGTVISAGSTLPAGYALAKERTNEHPLIAKQGFLLYEAEVSVPATHTAAQLTTATTTLTTAQTNYNTAVSDEATEKALYDAEIANCAITTIPTNAYLSGAAAEDIELLTLNDYTFVLNKKKVAAMKATTTGALPNQAFVVITVAAYNCQYELKIDSNTFVYQTRESTAAKTGTYTIAGTTSPRTVTCTINNHGLTTGDRVRLDFTSGSATDSTYVITRTGVNTFTVSDTQATTNTGGNVSAYIPVDAGIICNNLARLINDQGTYSATVVGPGIYISHTSAFAIECRGSTDNDGIFVFQDQVPNISKLPVQCKNGYKVKVINSQEIDVDDMWVEFYTTNSATQGPGTWEESVAPGVQYELDELTLPHQLVRQTDGSFNFQPVTWEDRTVGDNETNPLPSFIGSTISNIFFYRNRLGFLSNEAVVLGKAGDYFNFFATTALTVTNDDPIDITASSTKPVTLNYVRPTSVGLVLFGQNEQFLLTTDSDVLSPTTAKINTLSTYECEPAVEAVTLGTTLAFISKTPLYTRFFELADIRNDSPPNMYDQTNLVPELIPSTIDSLVASPGLAITSFGTIGQSTIYQYRFLQQGDKRSGSTWYKWELTGTLLDQFFDASTFYATVTDGSKVYVVSMDLTQASEEGFLTLPTGERTDVCLDMWNVNPYRTYNSTTDLTRVYLPYNTFTGKTLSVLVLGGYIGASTGVSSASVGAVIYPTVQGSSGAYYVDLDGDYRGRDLIIGFIYDMVVDLPKFYYTKSSNDAAETDVTADLILHRIKVSTGLSGPVTYQISITGRPDWDNTVSVTMPNQYALNNVNMSAEAVHNVPLYQRNTNLLVRIKGDTPFPVSLLNMTWEGKYNKRSYSRV
jgi:hypothetical protein